MLHQHAHHYLHRADTDGLHHWRSWLCCAFLLLTTDKWFLTPNFSLYFASSCFSYKIASPTATLNIAYTFSFQRFCSLQKLIHLFAPPPPAVLGCPFYIILHVIHLLCCGAINLILLLCSSALHLDTVFLCSLKIFLGKNRNLCIKLWR